MRPIQNKYSLKVKTNAHESIVSDTNYIKIFKKIQIRAFSTIYIFLGVEPQFQRVIWAEISDVRHEYICRDINENEKRF